MNDPKPILRGNPGCSEVRVIVSRSPSAPCCGEYSYIRGGCARINSGGCDAQVGETADDTLLADVEVGICDCCTVYGKDVGLFPDDVQKVIYEKKKLLPPKRKTVIAFGMGYLL